MKRIPLLHHFTCPMKSLTNNQRLIKEVLEIGHWWSRLAIITFMYGVRPRKKIIEYNLPRMVVKGAIKEAWYNGRKVYSVIGSRQHIAHGVACIQALISFLLADPDCTVIGENWLRKGKFGCIPEWGILYPNGNLLLFEYCTRDNAIRSGLVARKVNAYKKYLTKIEETYQATVVVLFVIDLPTIDVKALASRYLADTNFIYFTDHQTFSGQPLGRALESNIYFMADGRPEGLRDV